MVTVWSCVVISFSPLGTIFLLARVVPSLVRFCSVWLHPRRTFLAAYECRSVLFVGDNIQVSSRQRAPYFVMRIWSVVSLNHWGFADSEGRKTISQQIQQRFTTPYTRWVWKKSALHHTIHTMSVKKYVSTPFERKSKYCTFPHTNFFRRFRESVQMLIFQHECYWSVSDSPVSLCEL
jgi:hypothetical protein